VQQCCAETFAGGAGCGFVQQQREFVLRAARGQYSLRAMGRQGGCEFSSHLVGKGAAVAGAQFRQPDATYNEKPHAAPLGRRRGPAACKIFGVPAPVPFQFGNGAGEQDLARGQFSQAIEASAFVQKQILKAEAHDAGQRGQQGTHGLGRDSAGHKDAKYLTVNGKRKKEPVFARQPLGLMGDLFAGEIQPVGSKGKKTRKPFAQEWFQFNKVMAAQPRPAGGGIFHAGAIASERRLEKSLEQAVRFAL
jgi:hypothetical protein